MQWSIAANVLLVPFASALETVTVCRNTYSSDFLIQVIPLTSAVAKRQNSAASGYLEQNGLITHNCQQASTWNLANAQLSSGGDKISALQNVASSRFAVTHIPKAISTKFATTDGFLFWDNEAFQDGTARFCATPGFNGSLFAVFDGAIGLGCTQATLRTVPISSCNGFVLPSAPGSTATAPRSIGQSSDLIDSTTSSVLSSESSFSAPFITGVPAPSQNISSSFSAPFITGVPAPSQNTSSIFSNASSVDTETSFTSASQTNTSFTASTIGISTTSATTPHSPYTGVPTFSNGNEYGSLESSTESATPTVSQNSSTAAASTGFSLSSNSTSSLASLTTRATSTSVGVPTFSNGNEYGSIGSSSPSGSPTGVQNSSSTIVSSGFPLSSNSSSSLLSPSTRVNNTSASATSISANSTTSLLGTASRSNTTSANVPAITSNSSSLPLPTSTSTSNSSLSTFSSSNLTATSASANLTFTSTPFNASSTSVLTSSLIANSTSSLNSTYLSTSSILSSTSITATSSTSIPPFSIASSRIAENRTYITFCSSYLGYTNATSQATVTIDKTVQETSVLTTTLPVKTIIDVFKSTRVTTVTKPSDSITVEVTPSASIGFTIVAINNATQTQVVTETVDDFTQVIQKRQASQSTSSASLPPGLQTFDPIVISSACSANVPSPSALPNATVTRIFTDEEVQQVTATPRYQTVNVSSEYDVAVTVTSGDYVTTITESRRTYRFTTTITTTKTVNATATMTATNTVPTIILAHPTPIIGSVNGSIADYDDFAYNLTLPFPLQLYTHSSPKIWVSTNGLLSLDTGSWYYNNAPLPRYLPIPTYTLFPFWDDTYIYQGQPQGIYYEVTGGGKGTRVAFEFYLSHYHDGEEYYHYTVGYDTEDPGVYVVKYYQVSDQGTSATVGMQDYTGHLYSQYSYNTPDIYPGLELTFNSNTGVITSSTFDLGGNQTSSTG